jgi:DNA-binding NarL/FixJ family response regulator
MEKKIRVLIADDQVLFAESLSYVLRGAAERVEVVGIAHDGEEALELTRLHGPDVILMDVRMPRLDGVEATKLIHLEHPSIRIVVLTTFDDDEYVHAALKYGAVGYLLKNIRAPASLTRRSRPS